MSRQFTDPSGRRWRVDTHRAGKGELEFERVLPWRMGRMHVAQLANTIVLLLGVIVLDVVKPVNVLTAIFLGSAIGAVFWRPTPAPDPLVFSAPFALRTDLNDAELSKAVQAAERMRDYPDDTGPIDMRASIALAIRSENPPSRLAR